MNNSHNRSIQPNSSNKELGWFLDLVASDLAADKNLLISGSDCFGQGSANILIRPSESKSTCRFPRYQFDAGFDFQNDCKIVVKSVIRGILPKFREQWKENQQSKLMGQKVMPLTPDGSGFFFQSLADQRKSFLEFVYLCLNESWYIRGRRVG